METPQPRGFRADRPETGRIARGGQPGVPGPECLGPDQRGAGPRDAWGAARNLKFYREADLGSTTKSEKDSSQTEFPFGVGEANLDQEIRAALRKVRRHSRQSVEQIAEGMTRRLGLRVSHHQLNAYTSDRHARRFPLAWIKAWHEQTGDLSLLETVVKSMGMRLTKPRDADLQDFARARITSEIEQQKADYLKTRLLRGGAV